MALERDINGLLDPDNRVFIGEDKDLDFTIFVDSDEAEVVDVSGFEMAFAVRKYDHSTAAVIEKTTDQPSPTGITISGVFNSDPDTNTQKVTVNLLRSDTYDLEASPPVSVKKGLYRYTLRRTDDGSNTVLAFGDFVLLQASAR